LRGGKIPLLYTDAANPASNKAYRNIGFVFGGQVKNYEFEG
jgi:predicted GNAT family acetyltransferase